MIAKLVADFDANPRGGSDRLEQARRLCKSADARDRNYLDLRIREETTGRTLAWFIGLTPQQRVAVARRA